GGSRDGVAATPAVPSSCCHTTPAGRLSGEACASGGRTGRNGWPQWGQRTSWPEEASATGTACRQLGWGQRVSAGRASQGGRDLWGGTLRRIRHPGHSPSVSGPERGHNPPGAVAPFRPAGPAAAALPRRADPRLLHAPEGPSGPAEPVVAPGNLGAMSAAGGWRTLSRKTGGG